MNQPNLIPHNPEQPMPLNVSATKETMRAYAAEFNGRIKKARSSAERQAANKLLTLYAHEIDSATIRTYLTEVGKFTLIECPDAAEIIDQSEGLCAFYIDSEDIAADRTKIKKYLKGFNITPEWDCTLKQAHKDTFLHLCYYLGKHYLVNHLHKLPEDRMFWISEQAVADKLGISRSTIWRHLKRLHLTGMCEGESWIYHGSNHGIELALNTALVELNPGFFHPETMPAPDAVLGGNVAICTHTDIPKEAINKNMASQKGVDKSTNLLTNGSLGQWKHTEEVAPVKSHPAHGSVAAHEPMDAAGAARADSDAEFNQFLQKYNTTTETKPAQHPQRDSSLDTWIKDCLITMLRLLYRGQRFDMHILEQCEEHLEHHFKKLGYKYNSQAASVINQRIMLKFYDMQRRPLKSYVPPNPAMWINPRFKNGFMITEDWLKNVQERRKIRKDYHTNQRETERLIMWVRKYPTRENYRTAESKLSRFRDKGKCLQIFYECIGENKPFSYSEFTFEKVHNEFYNKTA